MSKKKHDIDENTAEPQVTVDNTDTKDTTDTRESEKVPASEDKDEVAQLRENLAEINDKYLRLYSEFDNFKRRTARERIELLQSASKDLMVALLPVLDDFERAEKSFQTATEPEAVKEGVKLIHQKLRSILNQNGLQALDSVGKDFDVDFHEAITKIPAPSEGMKGKVVDEVERGYQLRDKVIRFAKVVVGE